MLGIDCQSDRIEWALLGLGRESRRYIVDYGTIGKHISEPDCQRNLDILLAKSWKNSFGREMKITLAAIDANYWTDDVLAYCRRYSPYKLIAVRGSHGDAAPRIAKVMRERDEKLGTLLKNSGRFFNVGVSALKMTLYRDLLKDNPADPGYVSFPCDCEDRFYQELVAETRVSHQRFGQTVWRWERPKNQACEMLDCVVYASAASIKYGVNWISDQGWSKLEEKFEVEIPVSSGPKGPGFAERVMTIQGREVHRHGIIEDVLEAELDIALGRDRYQRPKRLVRLQRQLAGNKLLIIDELGYGRCRKPQPNCFSRSSASAMSKARRLSPAICPLMSAARRLALEGHMHA